MSPPHGDLVLSVDSIRASPNLDILGVNFDSKLSFEDHVHSIVSSVSQRIGILRLVKRIFVDTSVILRCYYAFVLPILEYCSPVWGSAAECHLQLLERQVYSVARLCPDQNFLSLSHRCRVAGLSMLYMVNSNSNHSLFSELPSASTRVRHTQAAAAAHPLEFEVSSCRTSQFARSYLPAQVGLWNDLPYTVFDTGTLYGFKGAVNRWLFPELFFLHFSVAQMLVALRKQFIKNFCFSYLGLCCWF